MSFSVRILHDINITPKYMFHIKCNIIRNEYFIASYLLSPNEAGYDGALQERLLEMHEQIYSC